MLLILVPIWAFFFVGAFIAAGNGHWGGAFFMGLVAFSPLLIGVIKILRIRAKTKNAEINKKLEAERQLAEQAKKKAEATAAAEARVSELLKKFDIPDGNSVFGLNRNTGALRFVLAHDDKGNLLIVENDNVKHEQTWFGSAAGITTSSYTGVLNIWPDGLGSVIFTALWDECGISTEQQELWVDRINTLQKQEAQKLSQRENEKKQKIQEAEKVLVQEMEKTLHNSGLINPVSTYKLNGESSAIEFVLACDRQGNLLVHKGDEKWQGSMKGSSAKIAKDGDKEWLEIEVHDEPYEQEFLKKRRFDVLQGFERGTLVEWMDRFSILGGKV